MYEDRFIPLDEETKSIINHLEILRPTLNLKSDSILKVNPLHYVFYVLQL